MKKLKIIVTGSSGLVGSLFVEKYKHVFDFITPEYPDFDITDPDSVFKAITQATPDWVVNFAAFTDVNAAEDQARDKSSLAWKVNVEGVENITQAFLSPNIIHISTDMVFPGSIDYPGPYDETAKTPDTDENLTWYGWTKNRAEKHVLNQGGRVLRIIYPVRAKFDQKLGYIRGALARFASGKMYPLFHDQHISIAYIEEIADTIHKIITTEAAGIFHCSSDSVTPYELIKYVLDQLGVDSSSLKSASIVDFLATQKNPYRYPQYGGLKTKQTEKNLQMHFSSWQTVVEYLIGQGLNLPKID